ncbi:LADA_0A04412g1_1 [Lachancea dasiensis]|uniref:LADA_0A04412g1_1 n=1 Tax=Lachancea dasiensis TaxID=1072105 RepID=A0A1G4INJ8_9SACH|nr:LADA_0A04412g1_1 [Lachancea dasiensis]
MESPKPLPNPPKSTRSGASPTRNQNSPSKSVDEEDFEFYNEFSRGNVKDLIHALTQELKRTALDTEYLFLPFRPEQSNEKLLKFLNRVFPLGNGVAVADGKLDRLIRATDQWTLFQALKYIWARLPEGQVVTWSAYHAFEEREKADGFSPKAFLELMPKCLVSPDHASIVYDFFDLIVTMASNSKRNKMSARKISKMFGIWAFGSDGGRNAATSYDFDNGVDKRNEDINTFQSGLDQWIPASDAMFHLLLAFIRSFVPHDLNDAKIPTTLKTILFNNNYPPKDSTAYSSETTLTVPIVSLKTTKFSKKPWQLIERCNQLFDFANHDAFAAREDYALLKSLFKKKKNIEGISRKMSKESRRLMKEMSTKHSTFQAGWASQTCISSAGASKGPSEHLQMSRVNIDDYFIWAWLSSLSHEQTSRKRKIFGRSLILEFEFDGFKKWMVIEESDLNVELAKRQKFDSLENIPHDDSAIPIIQQAKNARNITPAYEKFQKNVTTENSVAAAEKKLPFAPSIVNSHDGQNTSPSPQPKDHLNAFNSNSKLNSLQSISKTHHASKKSPSTFQAPLNETGHEQPTYKNHINSDNNTNRHDSRVLSQFSMLNPANYELPTVKREEFKVDLPSFDKESEDYKGQGNEFTEPVTLSVTPRNKERVKSTCIDDLNLLVDKLNHQVLNSDQEDEKSTEHGSETFESLTMFDKYKNIPGQSTDTLAESATSSVAPLKIGGGQFDQHSMASQTPLRINNQDGPNSNSFVHINSNDVNPIASLPGSATDVNSYHDTNPSFVARKKVPNRKEPVAVSNEIPHYDMPSQTSLSKSSSPILSAPRENLGPTRTKERATEVHHNNVQQPVVPIKISRHSPVVAQEPMYYSHQLNEEHRKQPTTGMVMPQAHVQAQNTAHSQQPQVYPPNVHYASRQEGLHSHARPRHDSPHRMKHTIAQPYNQNLVLNSRMDSPHWISQPTLNTYPPDQRQIRAGHSASEPSFNSPTSQAQGSALKSPQLPHRFGHSPISNTTHYMAPNYQNTGHQRPVNSNPRIVTQNQPQLPSNAITSPVGPVPSRTQHPPTSAVHGYPIQQSPRMGSPGTFIPLTTGQHVPYSSSPSHLGYGVMQTTGSPRPPIGGKLHGGFATKKDDRKRLHDTIRNGAFGI